MPLPTSYTEDQFKSYIFSRAQDMSKVLGWTVAGGSFDEIVNDTLLFLKLDDLSEVNSSAGVEKLRAAGMVFFWRAAIDALPTRYDFSSAGGTVSRSQMMRNAQAALTLAESRATDLGLNMNVPVVKVGSIVFADDPYGPDKASIYPLREPGDL